jgi:sensor histidine kinase YesM
LRDGRASGAGVGIDNVTRRLQHYYGDEAGLTVAAAADGSTIAELRLPVVDIDDPHVRVGTRSAMS